MLLPRKKATSHIQILHTDIFSIPAVNDVGNRCRFIEIVFFLHFRKNNFIAQAAGNMVELFLFQGYPCDCKLLTFSSGRRFLPQAPCSPVKKTITSISSIRTNVFFVKEAIIFLVISIIVYIVLLNNKLKSIHKYLDFFS